MKFFSINFTVVHCHKNIKDISLMFFVRTSKDLNKYGVRLAFYVLRICIAILNFFFYIIYKNKIVKLSFSTMIKNSTCQKSTTIILPILILLYNIG